MKRFIMGFATVAAIGLSGCSSTNKSADVSPGIPAGAQIAISEQLAVSEFKRKGIKVVYSLTGKLEAIEATGYAPVWGRSQNSVRESYRIAELEAKKSINDFINQEVIKTESAVRTISRNIERARDNKTNNFATNRNRDVVASITDDEDSKSDDDHNYNREMNTAVRNDAISIATVVNNTIHIRNQGILSGLYLVEGDIVEGGRVVRAVYRWDQKHTSVRNDIRNQMSR